MSPTARAHRHLVCLKIPSQVEMKRATATRRRGKSFDFFVGAGFALAVALVVPGYGTATTSHISHRNFPSSASSRSAGASNVPAAAPQALGPAPGFSVTDTDGQTVTVPSTHTTVLYVMAALYGSCRAGEQQLAQLQPRLPQEVEMVSLDATPQTDTIVTLDQLAAAAGLDRCGREVAAGVCVQRGDFGIQGRLPGRRGGGESERTAGV